MTEIVKVQRPLMTSTPGTPWLVYDRNRRHEEFIPAAAIPLYVKEAMGEDFKAYFIGYWSSIVGWGLSERVKDQDW